MKVNAKGTSGDLLKIEASCGCVSYLGGKTIRKIAGYEVTIWDSENNREIYYPEVMEKDIEF